MEVETAFSFLDLTPAEKVAIALDCQPTYVFNIDSQQCNGVDKYLAATSSNNSIHIYNRQRLGLISTIKGHENVLTGVKFSRQNPHLLFSSSIDGSIRCWDLRIESNKEALKFVGRRKYNFYSFDVNCDDTLICAGTQKVENERGNSALLLWDCRMAKRLNRFDEFHTDDITQVKFHSEKSQIAATGSADNLICVLDFSLISDELMLVLNAEVSVSKINWCGPNHNFMYCVTDFNTFFLWDTNKSSVLVHFNNIQNKFENTLDVDYLVDCFQYNSDLIIIGGSHKGQLHFLTIQNEELSFIRSLNGGHTDTIRDLHWDQETASLVTGGEDSFLCLWKSGSFLEESAHQSMKMTSAQFQVKPHNVKPY